MGMHFCFCPLLSFLISRLRLWPKRAWNPNLRSGCFSHFVLHTANLKKQCAGWVQQHGTSPKNAPGLQLRSVLKRKLFMLQWVVGEACFWPCQRTEPTARHPFRLWYLFAWTSKARMIYRKVKSLHKKHVEPMWLHVQSAGWGIKNTYKHREITGTWLSGCIPVFQSQMDIAGVHPALQNRISVLRNDSQRKPWKLQSWKCSTDDCGGASNATFPTFGGFSISDRRIFTKNHSLFQNQGNVCVLLRQICCLKQTRELRQRYSASFWHFEANDFGSTYIYPYGIRRRVSAGDISWLFFPRWSASHLFHGSSVQLNGLKPAAEITILRRPKVWCVLRRAGSTCFRGNVHLFLHQGKNRVHNSHWNLCCQHTNESRDFVAVFSLQRKNNAGKPYFRKNLVGANQRLGVCVSFVSFINRFGCIKLQFNKCHVMYQTNEAAWHPVLAKLLYFYPSSLVSVATDRK